MAQADMAKGHEAFYQAFPNTEHNRSTQHWCVGKWSMYSEWWFNVDIILFTNGISTLNLEWVIIKMLRTIPFSTKRDT